MSHTALLTRWGLPALLSLSTIACTGGTTPPESSTNSSDNAIPSSSSQPTVSSSLAQSSSSVAVSSSSIAVSSSSTAVSSSSSSEAAPINLPLVIAINAGSTDTVNYDGNTYQADKYSTGGTANTTADAISGVAQGALFQSERYGEYSYSIPVLTGTYTVELHMVEMYHTSAGLRSFDTTIENTKVLSALDLYSQVGHDGAYSYIADPIRVTDGKLDIAFTPLTDQGTLSGFAVYSADGGIDTSVPEPEPSNCTGYVGITFDDGPANTTAFVNALKQNDLVPVTFFVNGNKIGQNPNAIAQMLTVGEVQNHLYTHTNMVNAGYSYQQAYDALQQNNQAIQNAGAPKPTIFRPPEGASNSEHQRAASDLGMITITWTNDSSDWSGVSTSAIVNAANQLNDGDVILMHENQTNTLAAIPQIAANLKAKGLCPGRVDSSNSNGGRGRAIAP